MDVYDYSYGVDMADVAIQIQNAGYSGSAAWDLDDAMHTKNDLGQKNKLKRWVCGTASVPKFVKIPTTKISVRGFIRGHCYAAIFHPVILLLKPIQQELKVCD